MAEQAANARSAAEASRRDALSHLEKGEFAAALGCYDAALASARETEEPAFVDWIYVCRAAAAAETGPASDELVELKRILLRTREPQTAFRAAYSSAAIYRLRKERNKVFFYANLARRHAEEIGDPRLIGACLNEVGNALAADSRFEEAAEAYRTALERTRAEAALLSVSRAQWSDNLGYCHIALDRVRRGARARARGARHAREGSRPRLHGVSAPRPLLRLPQAGPVRGGPLVRRGRPLAGRRRRRPRGREEPPVPPRRGLPPLGRRARGAGLLRPSRAISIRTSRTSARTSTSSTSATSSTSGADAVITASHRPFAARLRAALLGLAVGCGSQWRRRAAGGRRKRGAREGRLALRGVHDELRPGHHRSELDRCRGLGRRAAHDASRAGADGRGRGRHVQRPEEVRGIARVRRLHEHRLRGLHEPPGPGVLRGHSRRDAARRQLVRRPLPSEPRPVLLGEPPPPRDAAGLQGLRRRKATW